MGTGQNASSNLDGRQGAGGAGRLFAKVRSDAEMARCDDEWMAKVTKERMGNGRHRGC